jgi:acetylornithine deacetylase
MKELFELTRRLIDIPSLTGEEESVGEFLISLLKERGYHVETQEVAAGRSNIIATTGAPARVVFSTHIDTVPPFISSSEDDEYIYGRGACDTKGIIAAMIMAADKLRAEGMKELGLLFVVDEEMSSIGARAANNHPIAKECKYLINGEPTENRLAIGSKGSLRLSVRTEGRSAHSAYPEQGESAIEKLLDFLSDVRNFRWPTDPYFGDTTCNIGTIQGGTRPNVIPAEAKSDMQIRLVTDAELIKGLIEQLAEGRAEVEYLSYNNPVRMLAVEGFEQEVVRFTTDVPYLTNWGSPLLLGPGSILDAHTAHERIQKRELIEAVDLYIRLVHTLLANNGDKR